MSTVDFVLLFRFPIDASGLTDSARHELVSQVDVPDWMLSAQNTMLPSDRYLRLWELVEHELDDPDIAVHTAHAYVPGQLGLVDHLLMTAPTLGDGCAATSQYMHVASTNHSWSAVEESAGTVGVDLGLVHGGGRGGDLAMQAALCGTVTKFRRVAKAAVSPIRVRFQQPAPRRHTELIELLGTDEVEFGAATNRITYRSQDLTLPLSTSNPILAGILTRYADTMPRPRVTTWSERLQQMLRPMLEEGPVNLDHVVRQMLTSRRTLQRRLTEEGTTWQIELDRARRTHMESLGTATANRFELARHLGYSDTRAFNRACNRWFSQQ